MKRPNFAATWPITVAMPVGGGITGRDPSVALN